MHSLLDTHQHLIYRDRLGYGWSDSEPALAGRDFTVADHHRLTAGEVGASIFMETGVDDADYQAETRFVAELAADVANRIVGIIATCRAETDDGFEAWLDECGDLPVVAFRRMLHVVPDGMSAETVFRRNVREIGARGHVFDMCFRADQLKIAAEFIRACDNTSLVLDHCGVPDIAGGSFEPWRQDITAIAAFPHVSCKVSGVLAYCTPGEATIDAIRPYIEHVIDSFGLERVFFGSDWPVVDTRSTLPEWIAMFRELTAGLSDSEAEAICNGNAQRIYGVTMP